jgi:hypothetical protein
MPHQDTLLNVPNAKVAETEQDFYNAGATNVTTTGNVDGRSAVSATFPDRTEAVLNVPSEKVADTVQDLKNSGATDVAVTANQKNASAVVADFP